ETPAADRVDVPYASQVPAGDVFAVTTAEPDDLVADHAGLRVGWQAFDGAVAHLAFGAGDEEGAGLVDGEEAFEIDVPAVQNVEGTGQQRQQVEGGDVGGFSAGNPHENGDSDQQIQQHMGLDCAFGLLEAGPGEQRQAQVDGGRVQREGRLDFQAVQVRIGREFMACRGDHRHRGVGEDAV